MPVRIVISIWPLFLGLALIGLAVGVQGSLLGVRAEMEGFEDSLIGLLMSCYFAGFLGGSLLAPGLIQRVGHIRIFAALSAVASVTILMHSLYVEPWTWAAMRLLTGFAFSCIIFWGLNIFDHLDIFSMLLELTQSHLLVENSLK